MLTKSRQAVERMEKLQPVHTDWSLYIVGDGEYRENLEKYPKNII